jgi:hypothetical protein
MIQTSLDEFGVAPPLTASHWRAQRDLRDFDSSTKVIPMTKVRVSTHFERICLDALRKQLRRNVMQQRRLPCSQPTNNTRAFFA